MKRQPINQPKATRRQAGPAVALKNILVPTDFSEASGKALQFAAALAAQLHASVACSISPKSARWIMSKERAIFRAWSCSFSMLRKALRTKEGKS